MRNDDYESTIYINENNDQNNLGLEIEGLNKTSRPKLRDIVEFTVDGYNKQGKFVKVGKPAGKDKK